MCNPSTRSLVRYLNNLLILKGTNPETLNRLLPLLKKQIGTRWTSWCLPKRPVSPFRGTSKACRGSVFPFSVTYEKLGLVAVIESAQDIYIFRDLLYKLLSEASIPVLILSMTGLSDLKIAFMLQTSRWLGKWIIRTFEEGDDSVNGCPWLTT
jgi:hypothetical protein